MPHESIDSKFINHKQSWSDKVHAAESIPQVKTASNKYH